MSLKKRFALCVALACLITTAVRAEGTTDPPHGGAEEDGLRISLLTMGPGDHPFFKFGHNALWIRDSVRHVDKVYNYGTFSFDSWALIPRFLRGRFDYWLSVQSLQRTLAAYAAENRSIVAQELRLTSAEKGELVRFLDWNARDENKYYRYDYYLDNCSTRLRDLIDRVTRGRLRAVSGGPASMTFRAHTERLTAGDWPVYLGLDVAMSDVIDRPVRVWDEMFLPAELQETIRRATVPGAAGEQPLVVSEQTLVAANRAAPLAKPPGRLLPLLAVGAALGAVLGALGTLAGRGSKGARVGFAALAGLTGTVLGLLGTLFLLLWAFTNHVVAHHNENTLQCAPWALALPLLAVGVARAHERTERTFLRVAVAAFAASAIGLVAKALPAFDQSNAPFIALLLPVWTGMVVGATRLRSQAFRRAIMAPKGRRPVTSR